MTASEKAELYAKMVAIANAGLVKWRIGRHGLIGYVMGTGYEIHVTERNSALLYTEDGLTIPLVDIQTPGKQIIADLGDIAGQQCSAQFAMVNTKAPELLSAFRLIETTSPPAGDSSSPSDTGAVGNAAASDEGSK